MRRAQVAFVAASDTSNVILSEHAEALTARHRHALRRVRIAAQRAVFDWHRQALRAQRNRKRVHAFGTFGWPWYRYCRPRCYGQ